MRRQPCHVRRIGQVPKTAPEPRAGRYGGIYVAGGLNERSKIFANLTDAIPKRSEERTIDSIQKPVITS